MSYSKITLLGNVTRDPEVRYTQAGTAVMKFGMAENRYISKEEGSRTCYYNITVFGKRAESMSQHIRKGSPLLVTGTLNFDKETGNPNVFTRKDGKSGAAFEIVVDDIALVGGSRQAGQQDAGDIPF